MKKSIVLACLIFVTGIAKAQTEMDSAKNELVKINQVFDSSLYLSFDMEISYRGDSATKIEPVETDFVSGRYVLNNRHVYYEMGDLIFAQTDSFNYNIYTDERLMIMTKSTPLSNSNYFPIRNFLDSIVKSADYAVTIDTLPLPDSLAEDSPDYDKIISFVRKPYSTALYEYVTVKYDRESYYPYVYEFAYADAGYMQITEDSAHSFEITRKVSMNFKNYRPLYTTRLFDDNEYVIYNRQRKIFEASEKYKTYQFITSGFSNIDPEEEMYSEVPFTEDIF